MERHGKQWLAMPSAALCSLLCGCASQGPLRPPSLNLPAAVRHLDAKRVGGTVELSWTNPTKTSDGVLLTAKHGAGMLNVEICRSEKTLNDSCTPVRTLPVRSGELSSVRDALSTEQASGSVRALFYRVRVVNARGNGGKWADVTTAAGASLKTLRGLQAHPVANGILLRWENEPSAGQTMLRVSRGADTSKSELLRVSTLTPGQQAHSPEPEWTGTVDTGGHAGLEQRYTGFRVSSMQIGGQAISMQSEPVSVTVSATAKLPLPAAPTALEAVANTLGTPEVDLVWQPPDDASVTGYRVYRQEGAAEPVLLTPQPLSGFTFADHTAQSGHRYTYGVSAVNPSGESAAAAATAALP